MKERWYLLIPLLVLVWLLFSGRTPMFAGTIGLSLTAIVILGSAIILKVSSFGLRIAFWIALGLLCAGFFQLGIGVIFGVIAALVVVCWFIRAVATPWSSACTRWWKARAMRCRWASPAPWSV